MVPGFENGQEWEKWVNILEKYTQMPKCFEFANFFKLANMGQKQD